MTITKQETYLTSFDSNGDVSKALSILINHLVEGDLVYGCCEARSLLMDELKRLGISSTILIDDYNICIAGSVFFHLPSDPPLFDISRLNREELDSIAPGLYEKILKIRIESKKFYEFRSQFEQPEKYNDRDYYLNAALDKPGYSLDDFIKKGCKLGLLWCLNNRKTVHFILDGIDMNICFEKLEQKYTSSELRFIYRNWNFLKKYHLSGKINFYKSSNGFLVTVPAPWEEDKSIVEKYKPKGKNNLLYSSFFQHKVEDIVDQPVSIPASDRVDHANLCVSAKNNLPKDKDRNGDRIPPEITSGIFPRNAVKSHDSTRKELSEYKQTAISMQVLGSFITVFGALAVAVALTVLNAATFGIAGIPVAGIGFGLILAGVGLFTAGTYKNCQLGNLPKNLQKVGFQIQPI